MPFVDRNGSGAPHTQKNPRHIFIGRTDQVDFFVKNILDPEKPASNILSICGDGGVGKTTLLARLREEALTPPFRDYCLTTLVDEQQTTPLSIMEEVAGQLRHAGYPLSKFERVLKDHKKTLRRLLPNRETFAREIVREAPDTAGSLIEGASQAAGGGILIGGSLIKGEIKGIFNSIVNGFLRHQWFQDLQRLESGIENLTQSFVEDLNRAADVLVIRGSYQHVRHRRVILFFDTFEKLAPYAAPWLLDHFLKADISRDVVLVIAGRDPIEHAVPGRLTSWYHYINDGTIHPIQLERFTREEVREYLAARGIKQSDQQLDVLYQLSQGIPLYLAILTSGSQGEVDPTADVVANLLRWIPAEEDVKRRLILDAALFSRPFNQDDLAAFDYISGQERASLFDWLIGQPFVESLSQSGLYHYHVPARELFCRHLYQRSEEAYVSARRALARHYQKELEKALADEGKEVYASERWVDIVQALACQLFLLPDEESHIRGIEQVLVVSEYTRQASTIEQMLRELSEESPNNLANASVREIARLLLQCAHMHTMNAQDVLKVVRPLMQKAASMARHSPNLMAMLYRIKGRAYAALDKYAQAIQDYDQALQLAPTSVETHILRGEAYHVLKNYEQAIQDYSQVLQHEATASSIRMLRAFARFALGNYHQALEDLSEVLILHDDIAWAYVLRGAAYFFLGQPEQAIDDYNSAIERDPRYVGTYILRGLAYREQRDYQRALGDLDHALTMNTTLAWVYVLRGEIHRLCKDYRQAVEDIDRAGTLEGLSSWAYANRGVAYRHLGEYSKSLEDLKQALDLDPTVPWAYAELAETYRLLGDFDAALENFSKAIALEYKRPWVYARRGQVYSFRGEYQHSVDDLTLALSLNPQLVWAYSERAFAYLWLKEVEYAKADYTTCSLQNKADVNARWMIEWIDMCGDEKDASRAARLERIASINPQHWAAHVCSGVALWLTGQVSGALVELEEARKRAPEEWDAYFWSAMAYASAGQDAEAMTMIEKAQQAGLPPVLLAPLRWMEQERPDFFEQYVTRLLDQGEI
jgi:tetratricopeptide (TPR) repeat protein